MAQQQARTVVALPLQEGGHDCEHDHATLQDYARSLATFMGCGCAGVYDARRRYDTPLYFVPSETLHAAQAERLGIRDSGDLFGGVVPWPFVATKAISHPLLAPDSPRPPGWSDAFAHRIGDAVLPGYTVFGTVDALEAARRLLALGPVRLKPVRACGGRGQSVVRNLDQLREHLRRLDATELAGHGLALEQDLQEARTFSVGQVRVDGLVASYHGVQRLTRANDGQPVFGGSDLTVVRGGFDALAALHPPAELARAVQQARQFDEAAHACYPGFYASRSNYDIVLGRDAAGRWRSGVLEQSWRAGGATGPELGALMAFRLDLSLACVRARSVEVYGEAAPLPPHAHVHYRGSDARVGPLTKYTVVEPHVHQG
jgi:hypothetical protein